MREVQHDVDSSLPARMDGRTAAAMSKDELWNAVEVLSRVLGECARRNAPPDVYERIDVARAMVIGLYSTAPVPVRRVD